MSMIKKIQALLKSKKGASEIWSIAVITFILLFVSVLLGFFNIIYNQQTVKSTVRDVLDVQIVKNEVKHSDTVKRGSGSYVAIGESVAQKMNFDKDIFLKSLRRELHLDTDYKRRYPEGGIKYEIDNIKVNFIYDTELKVKVTYRIKIPYYFMGKAVACYENNVSVTTRHNSKYDTKQ